MRLLTDYQVCFVPFLHGGIGPHLLHEDKSRFLCLGRIRFVIWEPSASNGNSLERGFLQRFFKISAAGFPALHDISCAMFGSSQEILWDLLDEDLKPLHIWLLWFTTTTACLAPWPLSMGILGCRIHDCGRRRLAKTPGFIGHCLFSPNGCICGSSHIQWNTLAHNEL